MTGEGRTVRRFADWVDDRTGHRKILKAVLYEPIPGGARWRYVWGSTLTFALFVQLVTGVVLWAAYSPNAQGAWESVFYIQNQMAGGWLLRGIHHYTAQVTTVLLAIHLLQVVLDGAYRAPREINFWFGLILLGLVMGLSLTGYLLPWDEKGYWSTKVATSIASITPVIGPSLQRVLIGGADYGHHTLTRFFALHAGILPGAIILLIVGHVYLFRRHGITVARRRAGRDGMFWPDQVLRDAVACLAVMATVLGLVLWSGGAHLGAPADPTEPFAAARPDWTFLFLFQWLKYFPAGMEVWGALIIPGIIAMLVALMPILARFSWGHRFNLGVLAVLVLGIGVLTRAAIVEDAADPEFQLAREKAESLAERAQVLAMGPDGIPAGGALHLLRADPMVQGPRLFASNCASCHTYDGHDGLGNVPAEDPTAADLGGFATREWLEGFFDEERVLTPEYLGGTALARGRMARFVTRQVAQYDEEEQAQLADVILALSAEARLPGQEGADLADAARVERGRLFMGEGGLDCVRCHVFDGQGLDDPVGPTLDHYGSREWTSALIRDPAHPDFFGDRNDRMPSYGTDEILGDEAIHLIVDWLRNDWYRPGVDGQAAH